MTIGRACAISLPYSFAHLLGMVPALGRRGYRQADTITALSLRWLSNAVGGKPSPTTSHSAALASTGSYCANWVSRRARPSALR